MYRLCVRSQPWRLEVPNQGWPGLVPSGGKSWSAGWVTLWASSCRWGFPQGLSVPATWCLCQGQDLHRTTEGQMLEGGCCIKNHIRICLCSLSTPNCFSLHQRIAPAPQVTSGHREEGQVLCPWTQPSSWQEVWPVIRCSWAGDSKPLYFQIGKSKSMALPFHLAGICFLPGAKQRLRPSWLELPLVKRFLSKGSQLGSRQL